MLLFYCWWVGLMKQINTTNLYLINIKTIKIIIISKSFVKLRTCGSKKINCNKHYMYFSVRLLIRLGKTVMEGKGA